VLVELMGPESGVRVEAFEALADGDPIEAAPPADDDAAYPVRTPRLTPGDLLLLYTDGLVERRVPAKPSLLTEVTGRLAAASATPGQLTLTRLAAELNRPSPDDDTCTLTVRVVG